MKNDFFKTLWTLRFEKMRKNEEDAAWKYQAVMDECLEEFGAKDETVMLLRQLVKEERGHSKMAEELIGICQRNHPEFNDVTECEL